MAQQICPVCDCDIGDKSYEKEGIVYCCQPCAEGSSCECSCCYPQATDIPDAGGE
jgi:hypothetical protein